MDKEEWFKRFFHSDSLVMITHNKSCKIENINVIFGGQVPLPNSVRVGQNINPALDDIRIPQKQLLITDTMQRQVFLLEQLEKLHKTVVKSHIEPVIRILGLYSGFSTLWEKSNTADLAQMEIQERDTLIKLVKSGCAARVIVNLDIYKALFCGFTKEEIVIRVSDLCATCDELSGYNNFEIALAMNMINYEPIIILDKALLNFSSNFESRRNYSASRWTSDRWSIEGTSNEFDLLFQKFYQENVVFMKTLKLTNISDLIFFYCQQKLSEIDVER